MDRHQRQATCVRPPAAPGRMTACADIAERNDRVVVVDARIARCSAQDRYPSEIPIMPVQLERANVASRSNGASKSGRRGENGRQMSTKMIRPQVAHIYDDWNSVRTGRTSTASLASSIVGNETRMMSGRRCPGACARNLRATRRARRKRLSEILPGYPTDLSSPNRPALPSNSRIAARVMVLVNMVEC